MDYIFDNKHHREIELLVPASSPEVLRCAVRYGADAVYIGGEAFGLRAKARNFSKEEMAKSIAFAHAHGVRVHVTANILAHNYDLEGARTYFEELRDLIYELKSEDMKWVSAGEDFAKKRGKSSLLPATLLEKKEGSDRCIGVSPDALIVADPGMFSIVKEIWPEAEVHISTQANNTNYATYNFWWKMGAKRVVSARELSLTEISQIRQQIPEEMEIESFIHGAMCISYSGRCLLSNYFTGRDANHGACTHPCRWKYTVCTDQTTQDCANTENQSGENQCQDRELQYFVEEESRPGEYMPVYENERGTYIFNSRDLCMIEHIPDLVAAGIDSWKIEGRMKTALYVATVARTYRKAIDDYLESPEKYQANMEWYREQIAMCTYRRFNTGFYYGKPDETGQVYDSNTYVSEAVYLAMIEKVEDLGSSNIVMIPEETEEERRIRKAQKKRAAKNGNPEDAAKIVITDSQGNVVSDFEPKKPEKVTLDGSYALFEQRNKFSVGDELEIMKPDGTDELVRVEEMYHVCTEEEIHYQKKALAELSVLTDSDMRNGEKDMNTLFLRKVDNCPHAGEMVWIKLSKMPEVGDLLRRREG